MAQESLSDWIEKLSGAGLLRRHTSKKRVDELPCLMEDNPQQAVLVERVKDCRFPFFTNGHATREMYALALGCDPRKVGIEVAAKMGRWFPAKLVETAPCKEVIIRGEGRGSVDLPAVRLPSLRRPRLHGRHARRQPKSGHRRDQRRHPAPHVRAAQRDDGGHARGAALRGREGHEAFATCNTLWSTLLGRLRDYAEKP